MQFIRVKLMNIFLIIFFIAPLFLSNGLIQASGCQPLSETAEQELVKNFPLKNWLDHLHYFVEKVRGEVPNQGEGLHLVMSAMELGTVPGLTHSDGSPLNIKSGGVSVVVSDQSSLFPHFLRDQAKGQLTIIAPLMDNVSKNNMKHLGLVKPTVEGKQWEIGMFEYWTSEGTRFIFLENPVFLTFNSNPKKKGESIYEMRGVDKMEQHRIWSALNQAVALTFDYVKGDVYMPHDSHVSPASFYIRKRLHHRKILSAKPLVHNEGYVNDFWVESSKAEKVRRIWDISEKDMQEYFMQKDMFTMLAPAVRLAEQRELNTAFSVSDGTAKAINDRVVENKIDFFGRTEGVTNGLSDINRPHEISTLKKEVSESAMRESGITHPEVIKEFRETGFDYGYPGQPEAEIHWTKGRAKAAIQRNFGLDIDHNKPLFVTFSRLVHQKGIGFFVEQVEHVLKRGGQVVMGGPIGDKIGQAERDLAIALKERFEKENFPNRHNFHYIDGMIKGPLKSLMLAASDFFVIPSRYEPCGLTDVEALYMGSIPIVHNVGGLGKGANSIKYGPVNPDNQGAAIYEAINRAVEAFHNRKDFKKSQWSAMHEDHSWQRSFAKLMQIYRIEAAYQFITSLETAVKNGDMSVNSAKEIAWHRMVAPNKGDFPLFKSMLDRLDASRKGPLTTWLISTPD